MFCGQQNERERNTEREIERVWSKSVKIGKFEAVEHWKKNMNGVRVKQIER